MSGLKVAKPVHQAMLGTLGRGFVHRPPGPRTRARTRVATGLVPWTAVPIHWLNTWFAASLIPRPAEPSRWTINSNMVPWRAAPSHWTLWGLPWRAEPSHWYLLNSGTLLIVALNCHYVPRTIQILSVPSFSIDLTS